MEEQEKRSLVRPEKFVRDPETGMSKIDAASRETYVVLSCGDPTKPRNISAGTKVVYAQRANQYFRDDECTAGITDSEVAAMGLPTPPIIAEARRKLIDEMMKSGTDFNKDEIYAATSPQRLDPAVVYRTQLEALKAQRA